MFAIEVPAEQEDIHLCCSPQCQLDHFQVPPGYYARPGDSRGTDGYVKDHS